MDRNNELIHDFSLLRGRDGNIKNDDEIKDIFNKLNFDNWSDFFDWLILEFIIKVKEIDCGACCRTLLPLMVIKGQEFSGLDFNDVIKEKIRNLSDEERKNLLINYERYFNCYGSRNKLVYKIYSQIKSYYRTNYPNSLLEIAKVPTLTETFESLWECCTSNNRLCPKPSKWNDLFEMLKNTKQNQNGGWTPALPLILYAWGETTPMEKQSRFEEHIHWAYDNNQIEEIGKYLRLLPEEDWAHFGDI